MKVTTDACLFGAIVSKEYQLGKPGMTALDIGTGTGLLSLMIAQQVPFLQIDAIEIETEAAAQARENINASPWSNRINVINSDILSLDTARQYDLLFSNPPFYENELASPDRKKNIAHHNSDLPLSSLFSKIAQLLDQEGQCWLLLPYKRKEEIRPLLEENGFKMTRLFLIRNSARHNYSRIILCIKKNRGEKDLVPIEELDIFEEQNNYSASFIELLSPYYLKL